MLVDGTPYRSIWEEGEGVRVIDQTLLPDRFEIRDLYDLEAAAEAIEVMRVRGAPLIGATAAYGLALHLRRDPSDAAMQHAYQRLLATRPTAVNLRWALERMVGVLRELAPAHRAQSATLEARAICDEDVAINAAIGEHGANVLHQRYQSLGQPEVLHVLTHCNAGWLATVDWGTALAPIYKAHDAGLPVHVWVDETRPRNQGARLTAWELGRHGVPHTVIVDNAGGHLMQHQQVHLCVVGTDRTTSTGDVCNKIGTYLKALAAHDNGVPFYVAVPGPSIDWSLRQGVGHIPIEERDPTEVSHLEGQGQRVRVTPDSSPIKNYGFDVTPARLVTGLITERGVAPATEAGLRALYPDA